MLRVPPSAVSHSMNTLHKKEILHASPPPVGKNVLEDLDAIGHRNNFIAFHIQKLLWNVFAEIDYGSLPDPRKVSLRHMQSIAFEGMYSRIEDVELLQSQVRSINSEIAGKAEKILGEIQQIIIDCEKEWGLITQAAKRMDINGNGDQVRIWQDQAAVDVFAGDFGGRIALFGSARLKPNTPDYNAAVWLSRTLVEGMVDEEGRSEQVVTGAGPGIMQAGNKGALLAEWRVLKNLYRQLEDGTGNRDDIEQRIFNFRKQVHSAGIRIILPFEAGFNDHLQMNLTIKNFGPRKQGLVAVSAGRATSHDGEDMRLHKRHPAIFGFKGGFGTNDEMWEVLTLAQCKKMKPKFPVIVVGKDASDLFQKQLKSMSSWGTIDPEDFSLFTCCSNEVEAVRAYLDFHSIDPSPRMQQLLNERKPVLSAVGG